MFTRLLVLAGLATYAQFGICSPIEYECPIRISTVQSLREPMAGWHQSLERPFTSDHWNEEGYSQHNLDYVEFSVGAPEDRASLEPDHQSRNVKGVWTATWRFSKSEEIWFSCWYRGTTVILSKQLPSGLGTCSVKYNNNRGIMIEKVSCK